jgi:hypothetical protein
MGTHYTTDYFHGRRGRAYVRELYVRPKGLLLRKHIMHPRRLWRARKSFSGILLGGALQATLIGLAISGAWIGLIGLSAFVAVDLANAWRRGRLAAYGSRRIMAPWVLTYGVICPERFPASYTVRSIEVAGDVAAPGELMRRASLDARSKSPEKRILAVSSGGGHWMQLMRLKLAFEGAAVHFVSVADHAAEVAPCPFHRVRDANRWSKIGIAVLAAQVFWLTLRLRPDIVVSTGAAPGLFALCFGKLMGARTVWIDSIANTEEVSLSGRLARRCSDLWLTQWPHLARAGGPSFCGRLL